MVTKNDDSMKNIIETRAKLMKATRENAVVGVWTYDPGPLVSQSKRPAQIETGGEKGMVSKAIKKIEKVTPDATPKVNNAGQNQGQGL